MHSIVKKCFAGILKKFKRRSRLIRLFSICLCIYCFYILFNFVQSVTTWRTIKNVDPVYISRVLSSLKQSQKESKDFSTTPTSTDLNIEFDPNLPNLRKRIVRVIDSKTISTNPEALNDSNVQKNSIPIPVSGSLNVYVWRDHCSQSIDLLKARLGFPHNPWKKYFTHSLTLQHRFQGFGQRIFGYLIPPISGEYSLKLTFSGSIEVWLSPDDQPSNAAKQEFSSTNNIVRFFKRILFGQIEQVAYVQVNLVANKKQYLEILHTNSDSCELVVKWRRFDSDNYQPIEPSYLSPYIRNYTSKLVPETYEHFPLHEPSPLIKHFYHPHDERDRTYSLPAVNVSVIGDPKSWAIPLCQYRPSYTEKGSITNSHSLNLLSTHPYTKLYSRLVEPWVFNTVISSAHKESLIRLFMYHLTFTYPNVQLSRFLNLEGLSDSTNGDLYLIEVLVTVDGLSDRELLISEYVVLGHISLPWLILCQPTAMKIRRDTFVHFLVTHRNFSHMLREFIRNLERIYVETGDENFGVIIVNYESVDINVASLMQQSKLKHWSIIEIDGPWEKTTAINLGIDSVSNPDDIIFSTDLSLSIPSYLPDSIRKHTFQGYSGFAPIVFYFACDFSVNSLYKGFYSLNGFGLISLYKSDWLKVGGLDTTRFKSKWGLEDNDLANRILAKGYVLFRLVMRDFYHQNHTYSGMWEG